MSGIYGVVRCDGAPVPREMLAPVAAALAFHGPDGHGQWCGESAGLGQLMLHVTPESLHERLPASLRAAPHLIITADARIDNRDELFDALGAPGPGRDQTPDSSLILLAYERWGADCLTRLLGDFAFAIWNTRERTLFCARDPFGCAPFVYSVDGKRFIFASDVRGVVAALGSPDLNRPLLAAYLQMKTYHAEKRMTFFTDIVKLPPGHSLTWSAGGVKVSRYWSPESAPEVRLASDADYAEQMAALFRQAVTCRLRSAFAVGSHLSGGLDSSSISAMASQLLRERNRELAVFSWSPPPDPAGSLHPQGEHARIDAVCRQEDLSCEYVPATTESLIKTFRKDFTVEPVAMLAREENVQVRAGNRGIRVMLSGWGGDEAASVRWAARPAWQGPSGAGPRRLAGMVRDVVIRRLPDSLLGLTGANPFQMHQAPCIRSEFAHRYRREVEEMRNPAWRILPDVRETMRSRLETGHLPMRLEHWAASGAGHRVVYRYPMLDRRLVEFALGIPAARLWRAETGESLFHRVASGFLPASANWQTAKTEAATFAALKGDYFRAHSEWSARLARDSAVERVVDREKIRNAVQAGIHAKYIAALSGVREAFGCYAIRHPL